MCNCNDMIVKKTPHRQFKISWKKKFEWNIHFIILKIYVINKELWQCLFQIKILIDM